jgi:hypothetical protein
VGETAWDRSFSDDQIQALIRQGAVRADSQHRCACAHTHDSVRADTHTRRGPCYYLKG